MIINLCMSRLVSQMNENTYPNGLTSRLKTRLSSENVECSSDEQVVHSSNICESRPWLQAFDPPADFLYPHSMLSFISSIHGTSFGALVLHLSLLDHFLSHQSSPSDLCDSFAAPEYGMTPSQFTRSSFFS
jgi:hypothetical protein